MPQLEFVTLDVFTQTRFKGNPLAVLLVPAGQDVATDTMQTVAREFNLSETVFLHEVNDATAEVPEWRVRIFMIDHELPFAGHPTIGTACYALGTLAQDKVTGRLLCKAGAIEVDFADGVANAAIPHNVHVHTETPFTVAGVEHLQPKLKDSKVLSIDVVSPVKGMNFVNVELPNLRTLDLIECSGVKPNPSLDKEWNVGFAGSVFYVLGDRTTSPDGGLKQKIQMRMIEGNFEDPATGSAACGLSALLALKARESKVDFEITQGVEIGRQSDIGVSVTLNASADAVERLELRGSAVKVMEGKVDFD